MSFLLFPEQCWWRWGGKQVSLSIIEEIATPSKTRAGKWRILLDWGAPEKSSWFLKKLPTAASQRPQRALEFSYSCAFLLLPFPTYKLPCFRGVGTIRNWKALSKGNFSIYQILSFLHWHLTQFNYGLSKAFSTVGWSGKTDYTMSVNWWSWLGD